jgi:nucleotide-binding universal stress UspA family protein
MEKMLVCLDGSPRERIVLDEALALARKTGAALVLLRSVGIPREIPMEAYSIAPQDLPKLLEDRARADLDDLAAHIPPELRAGVRVLVGNPWQSIEKAAKDEAVDLIVIGSHGYGALDRVLGTTAAKVVNHADRSVLVVRR